MAISENNLSAADVAAVMRGNNCGGGMGGMGWGGEGMWWIIILFVLAALFGFGGMGFGGNGGGFGGGGNHFYGGFGCGGSPCATQADLAAGFNNSAVLGNLNDIQMALTQGFHGVDNALCHLGYQTQNGFYQLGSQLSDCCCKTQRAIDGVNYNMATQACDTRNLIQTVARDITDNANANARAVLDFLTKDKIDALRDENQSLKFAASQANQNSVIRAAIDAGTAEVIRRTGNDCPTPAYWVQPPTPVQAPCSWTQGYNGGCGCGNGNGGYAYA